MKYLLWIFKIFSAALLACFLALLGYAFVEYRLFSAIFIFLTVFFSFLSLIRKLGILAIFLLMLLIILAVFFGQMYITRSYLSNGEVAEWLNAPVLKTDRPFRVS